MLSYAASRSVAVRTSGALLILRLDITIIAAALYSLADGLRLSKRQVFWPILAAIWLYTLLVGAMLAVFRAALMGLLVVGGRRRSCITAGSTTPLRV